MTDTRQRKSAETTSKDVPSVEDWTRSVEAFTRMIDRLQTDYAELETRHTDLNAELAAVNDSLRLAADANRRLAANRDRVVAAVTSGIIAVDADGTVRLFNPAAEALLGIAAEDVINKPYADIWPERADDSATALACANGAAPVNNSRREVRQAGHTPVILSVSTARLGIPANGDGPVTTDGAIEVFSDLTPLERIHAELARMRTLAALGEMAATIAHEIRNPLGGIIGFAELLARRTDGEPAQSEMVTKILTGAQYLNTLVERLLSFAREPRLDRRRIEWRKFLDQVVDQYEDGARRRGARLTLVRDWSEKLETGSVDGICLRQALFNVLENAEQAVGDDDSVELKAEPTPDGGIRLSVSDKGCGIDPKMINRIFSPFVTTKKKGTGLGLATAKKLVEAHGGRIAIESKTRVGTTVRVELPPPAEGE
jgi:PAS domain S-box-containing protein